MKKQVLISLTISVLSIAIAQAFTWNGDHADPSEYEGIGFALYAKVENPKAGSTGGPLDQERFSVATFVDGKLRGYSNSCEVGKDGSKYFAVRVYGSEADNGSAISIHIVDNGGTPDYSEDDMEYLLAETITYSDGGTLGQPSSPYALSLIPCESFEIESPIIIAKGCTRQLEMKCVPEDASMPIVTITQTSGDEVATIDADLKITAIAYGEATFSAAGGNDFTVIVANPVKDVTLSEDGLYLYVGDTGTFTDLITIVGEDPYDTEHISCTIDYTAAASDVLSIVGDTYEAVAKGETMVTVTVTDLTFGTPITRQLTFSVLQPITSITGGEALLYSGIDTGHSLSEYFTSLPADAYEWVGFQVVEYNGTPAAEVPQDERCVTITREGYITVRRAGTAKVRIYPVHHSDSGIEAYVSITVEQPIIAIEAKDDEAIVGVGETKRILDHFTVTPNDYTVADPFQYASSDETVAAISGTDVKALKQGEATITISTRQVPTDSLLTASFKIKVSHAITGFSITGADSEGMLWVANDETTTFELKSLPEGSYFDASLVTIDGNAAIDEAGLLAVTPKLIGTEPLTIEYPAGDSKAVSSFTVNVGQKYPLPEGWSWITSPFTSTGSSLEDIFGDSLIEVRTRRAVLANDPEWGYFGDIESFLFDHFKVKMAQQPAEAKIVYGEVVNATGPCAVKASTGWTWMPNIFQHAIDINDANELWGDPFEEGDIIKSKDSGFALYDEGEWTGNLPTLMPGEAYMLYTTADTLSLWHPAAHAIDYKPMPRRAMAPARSYWEYDHSRYIDNMAMVARIADFDEGYQDGYTIGVFAGDECRGEGMHVGGLWFITAHGESGDTFTLRIRNKATGETAPLGGTYQFAQLLGSASSPIELAAPAISGMDDAAIGADICVSGASVMGEGIRIIDLCGNDVTRLNGNLAPGVYVVAKDGMAKKVIIR